MDDDFCDQRIVICGDGCPLIQCAVNTNTYTARELQVRHHTGAWPKIVDRILSIDPAFDCMAVEPDLFLTVSQRESRGQSYLLLNQVDPCNSLGNRVFNLNTCIHFHEVELLIRRQ